MIGSAAARLHGAETSVTDVDVLLSERDAAVLLPTLGLTPAAGAPSERFRSRVFARWVAPPLPVEFMAGLHLREADAWRPVRLASYVVIAGTPVSDKAELARLLRRFGRAKDLNRAALLDLIS